MLKLSLPYRSIEVVNKRLDMLAEAVKVFGDHISAQVLANSLTIGDAEGGSEQEFNDFKALVKVIKD